MMHCDNDVEPTPRPILGPTRRTLQLKDLRAFAVLQTRLQFLLTDELIARLRIFFEKEFLYRVGIHWGDNHTCGSLYSAMHRRALVESRLADTTKVFILEGRLKNISVPDLFILVLNVSTNRFRRVDGQPALVTSLAGRKTSPPQKPFRTTGTVEVKAEPSDNTVSRCSIRSTYFYLNQPRYVPMMLAGRSRSCA
jgi:hypothetical protein